MWQGTGGAAAHAEGAAVYPDHDGEQSRGGAGAGQGCGGGEHVQHQPALLPALHQTVGVLMDPNKTHRHPHPHHVHLQTLYILKTPYRNIVNR